jgi:molybdopterin-guanine dinucleotide biosynthesis protein A
MQNRNQITGIILSGGQSTRMSKEKGLCLLNDKPMIEHIIEVLQPVCSTILISTNKEEYKYLGYPLVNDKFDRIGPLNGIYSGLEASTTEDNIILSCDIPLVSVELIKYIYGLRAGFEVVVPRIENFYEPLCAYYNRKIINVIEKAIQSKSYKLISLIRSLNYLEVEIHKELSFYHPNLFENINSPIDLRRVENILRK